MLVARRRKIYFSTEESDKFGTFSNKIKKIIKLHVPKQST